MASITSSRNALKDQSILRLAQLAAESGQSYAKACLDKNNNIPTWSNTKPLKPNTDCLGNETTTCTDSSTNQACFITIDTTNNLRSSFIVNLPTIDSSNKVTALPSTGTVKLIRSSSGLAWKTYSQSIGVKQTPTQEQYNVATGGTITEFISTGQAGTTIGKRYRVHTFTSNGTLNVTKADKPFDVLVVGGGGSGGSSIAAQGTGGGGGGAGGYLEQQSTLALGSHSVVIGAGGVGATYVAGNSGGESRLGSIIVPGGGGGGGNTTGSSGGSGGGAGYYSSGGAGQSPFGNRGGSNLGLGGRIGGNGGGGATSAGADGIDSTTPGTAGGNGITSSITGLSVGRAGGGGGGGYSGGGGTSTHGGGSGGNGLYGNGIAATTCGGGGGGAGSYGAGGNGYNGCVIVRYEVSTQILGPYNEATGGVVTEFISTGQVGTETGHRYRVHTFTTSGTFTVVNSSGRPFDLLVIGGGGGGSGSSSGQGTGGGGGGAGGYIETQAIITSGSYNVVIGNGGGGSSGGSVGVTGGQSKLGDYIAGGGGGGGGNGAGASAGIPGASGGGAGYYSLGGLGVSSFGNDGGSNVGLDNRVAGNGGGGASNAGAAGGTVVRTDGSSGGNGIISSITGLSVGRAGGGGGGAVAWSGALGGTATHGGGTGGSAIVVGSSAAPSTGGGGGGGGGYVAGGSGGSGIVIVRYEIEDKPIVTSGLMLSLDASNISSYSGSGTTWYDISGNGRNATLVNGPVFSSSGPGSLVLDGSNDYISLPTTGFGPSSLSIEYWIKKLSGNGGYIHVTDNYDNPETRLYMNTTTLNSAVYDEGAYRWNNPVYSISTDIWYHIVATITNGYQAAYVNGTLVNTGTGFYNGSSNGNVYEHTIGTYNRPGAGYGGYWAGSISVYRYYNRAISQAEVTQNFNALKSRYGL